MKKLLVINFFVWALLCLTTIKPAQTQPPVPLPQAQWTWMLVMDGEVAPKLNAIPDIVELAANGSILGSVNYIVCYPTDRGYWLINQLPFLPDQLGWMEFPPNPPAPITIPQIQDFLLWCAVNAPADRYGLILWDHGNNIFKKEVDPTNQKGFMNNLKVWDLADAIINFNQAIDPLMLGKKLEVLGLDMCLMAWIETLDMLKNKVDYILASEMNIPVLSWDYNNFSAFVNAPPFPPPGEIICPKIVTDYIASLVVRGWDGTLSSAKMGFYDNPMRTDLMNFAAQLRLSLPACRPQILAARAATWFPLFDNLGRISPQLNAYDIGDFAQKIIAQPSPPVPVALKNAATVFLNSYNDNTNFKLAEGHSAMIRAWNNQVTGWKIWFPTNVLAQPEQPNYIDPNKIDFNNEWYKFLEDLALAGPVNGNLKLKVFLQGPYNNATGEMNTTLNSAGSIPANPPNLDIVDWVTVELRDAPNAAAATSATIVAQFACYILKDGRIVNLEGNNDLLCTLTPANDLYVVINHRNHLSIISSGPVVEAGGIFQYDFTTGAGQAFGDIPTQIEVEPGVWAMMAGDANSDGHIENKDKIDCWKVEAGNSGYLSADFNMDGQVDNNDKLNYWNPNVCHSSQVPQ